ncbi:hypothetical protein OIU77_021303 [Salix suchowensis]|uniref:Glycosyl hydrolase family 81 N-terminal domain-containing protein n=1 Tax=Salix suchowensis TaxID=1278906 RepID=A0ABQ9C9G9_9ROSI|nr:hypothetical protein OIU77_021303 [Salix suchowensis]
MLKKIKRRVKTIITKPFRKPRKRLPCEPPSPIPSPSPPPPPPPQPPTMAHLSSSKRPAFPFLFPKAQSTVLPDPSLFLSPSLLSSPLPTSSFFQNFTLKNGDQPEYIHPYLIKSSLSSLSVSYPSLFHNSSFMYQVFVADLTISATNKTDPDQGKSHVVSSYSDLSVTLDMPSAKLRFFLVRGSPFLTCLTTRNTEISISTIHAILSFYSSNSLTKYTVKLNNNQTWLIYSSSPINMSHGLSSITSEGFSGIIRIAVLPDSDPKYEAILDRFSSCYPISGDVAFTKPFCLEYKWEKKGWGDLLMLAHPLHLKLLSSKDSEVTVLDDFKYNSVDGELVGVVGDSWVLKTDPVSVTWHSIKGIKEESYGEIVDALVKDVGGLDSSAITTTSSYFYGKTDCKSSKAGFDS